MTGLIAYASMVSIVAVVFFLRWRDAETRLRWTERPKRPPLERLVSPKAPPAAVPRLPRKLPPRKRPQGDR